MITLTDTCSGGGTARPAVSRALCPAPHGHGVHVSRQGPSSGRTAGTASRAGHRCPRWQSSRDPGPWQPLPREGARALALDHSERRRHGPGDENSGGQRGRRAPAGQAGRTRARAMRVLASQDAGTRCASKRGWGTESRLSTATAGDFPKPEVRGGATGPPAGCGPRPSRAHAHCSHPQAAAASPPAR